MKNHEDKVTISGTYVVLSHRENILTDHCGMETSVGFDCNMNDFMMSLKHVT